MNTASWASMEADSGGGLPEPYLSPLTWCVSSTREAAEIVDTIAQLLKDNRLVFDALWSEQGRIIEVSLVFKDAR